MRLFGHFIKKIFTGSDAGANYYLPELPVHVYDDCLAMFDLSSSTVNEIYRRFEHNLLMLCEKAKADQKITCINAVLPVAIKLFFDEFISTQFSNTKTEESDTLLIRGRKQENISHIPYKLFYDFYMAIYENDSDYQQIMGDRYQYGSLVKRNYSKMFKWYEVAAKNGSIGAMLDLYGCYAFLKQDDDSSIFWLVEAAQMDDCYALYNLHLKFGNVNPFGKYIKIIRYYHNKELADYCLMRAAYLNRDEFAKIWHEDDSYSSEGLEETKKLCEILRDEFPIKYPDGKIDLKVELQKMRMQNSLKK